MPQVLAIGQTQLQLLHHAYTAIYPEVRPLLYSPVYRLIGAALFFQSRYKESLHTHHCAYVVALEAGDVWNMAESLSWQAGTLKACGEHARSIQKTEAALRLLDNSQETRDVVSKARLLAQWAESAALLGERSVQNGKCGRLSEKRTRRTATGSCNYLIIVRPGLIDLIERLMIPLPKNDEVAKLLAVIQKHPRLHIIHTQQCVPRYLEATL